MAKFIPNENTWVGFATALTGTVDSPKVADITGAKDLTALCTGLTASYQGNSVPTPSFSTLYETTIPGTQQATFSVDFYRDSVSATDLAWSTLPLGTTGFFLINRFGGLPIAGSVIEVWPVTVLSRSMANMANNTVVTFTVTCAVPQVPNDAATVVA